MATRFYFRENSTADVSPSVDADWDVGGSPFDRGMMYTVGSASDTLTTVGGFTATSGSSEERIHRQWISEPMVADLVFDTSVTYKCRVRASEQSVNDNLFPRSGLRIVSEDGTTVRHTVRAVGSGGAAPEWNVSDLLPSTFLNDAAGSGSYTTVEGDRLVLELGQITNVGSGAIQGTTQWGSDPANTDISFVNSTGTRPWFEVSLDNLFEAAPADPPAPPSQTPTPANFRPIVPAGGFGARAEWPAINPEPSSFQDFAFVPTGSIRDDHISDVSATKLRLFGAKVYRSSTQAIVDDGTFQALSFDTEEYDLGDFWVSGSATRLTCRLDGVYVIDAYAEFEANATGVRRAQIRLNGANQMKLLAIASPGAGISAGLPLTWTGRLTAGDYVEFLVRQNSGGNLNVQSGAANNYLAASYQGRI